MLTDHERRIKALEGLDLGAAAPSGDIDTATILKQISLLKSDVASMKSELTTFKEQTSQDLNALRIELRGYTDKEISALSKTLSKKMQENFDSLKYELERLRAEFETFKNKDHRDLEARVTALEKKLRDLQNAFANLKIPESSGGGGVSIEAFNELVQRVAALEQELAMLRNEFAKWMKEM